MMDATTTEALMRKLRLTPETRLLALSAPEPYVEALRAAGVTVSLATISESDTYDAVHSFIRSQEDVTLALTSALAALEPGGVFWIMWPKKTSGVSTDVSRDSIVQLAYPQGWGPVSNVAIDATWSALRLRRRPEAEE